MYYPAHSTKSKKMTQNVFLAIVGLHEDIVKLCDTLQAMLFKEKLGGIIGCKDKTTSWHLTGFPNGSKIGSTA